MVESTAPPFPPERDWSQVFSPQEAVKDIQTLSIGLVGQSAVGKTSLCRKFLKPEVKLNPKDAVSTLGVDMYNIYLRWRDTPIKIKIWDTAGQERFGGITKNYLQPLDGVLVVFAYDSEESFEQTTKWMQNIKEAKDIPFILVGNKCDLPDKLVSDEDLQAKAAEFPYGNVTTSAYTGQGVNNAFYSIVY